MATLVNNTKANAQGQSKLTLQEMRIADLAQTTTLRITPDIAANAPSALDAITAQETWQAMQLSPEAIADKLAQLRAANLSNQASAKQLQTLQTEAVGLRQQAQEYKNKKWQQPALYGAGVALVGAGWLWLHERKKRIRAQEHIALLHSESNSVLAMPEGPSLSFKESEPLAAPNVPSKNHTPRTPINDPIADSISPEDLLPYLAPVKPSASTLSSKKSTKTEPKQPWWKPKKPKAHLNVGSVSGLDSRNTRAHLSSSVAESEIQLYDELAQLEEMQASAQDIVNPNVELLTQTRVKPVSSEDAMGHLLEIRMAVEALCTLNQHFAAQRLLDQHIEAVPNTCAWAYIEYLNLCLHLGQRDEFEAMRKRYRMQFNRLAPYWMEPNASVQALDSYDRPIAELSAVWPTPDKAKAMIATWLLGALHARRLFQLPAYHDLLDLYEMFEFYEDAAASAEFVPTVSLLDLDYEFAVEVKLDEQSDQDRLRVIPAVKTGGFDVDFNVTQNPDQASGLMDILEPIKVAAAPKSP